MKDEEKTKEQLMKELTDLRQRVDTLESSYAERKRVGEELRLNNEVFKNIAEGIYLIGLDDGIIKWANRRLEEMFGYEPGEMIGGYVSMVNAPTDRTPEETKSEIVDMLRRTGEWHGEVNNIKKDGTTFWCYANVSVFDHPAYGKVIVSVHTDITERKRVEAELVKEQKRYQDLYNNAPAMFISVDHGSGNVIECNKTFIEKTGYCREEIVGHHILERYHDSILDNAKEAFESFLSEGIVENAELVLKKKDGGLINVILNVTSVKDKDGSILYSRSVWQDITERKKAEEELKNIFNLSPDMIAICTLEGKFIKVNPAWERVLGYRPDEILKLGWAKLVHPDDMKDTGKEVEKQQEGKPVLSFINRFKCKDGTYRIFEWQAMPSIEGIVYATARDITERRKLEELQQQQKGSLEQKNIALRELLEQIQTEKNRVKDDVAANVEETLLPILKKIRLKGASRKYVDLLKFHLDGLTSSFGHKITEKSIKLSPREIEICNMIKARLTSKEIAGLLDVSYQTIDKHRKNIRSKLRINKKSVNLTSFLSSS